MAKTLMVGYDLNKSGQNYAALIDALKTNYENWWHHLGSTWVIRTSKSCAEVRNELGRLIDGNDKLLVVELTSVGAWHGFSDKGSAWLQQNL